MMLQLGSVPTLVVSSPQVAKEIYKTHDVIFSNRPLLTIPNIISYGSKDIVFSTYSERWRQLKGLVVQNLLSSSRVKSFHQVRKEEIDATIRKIGESCGRVFDLTELFHSQSSNIICRVAFGRTSETKFTTIMRNLVSLLSVFTVGSYFTSLSWVDRLSGVIGRAEKASKEFDEFLEGIVEEHVSKRGGDHFSQSNNGQDLVDILLDIQGDKTTGFTLDKDTLKAVILDMFVGGTHTTSTTLEWIFSELIKHPRVMKKLLQEVTKIAQGGESVSEESLEKMPYLKAVVKESFRLHPAAPLLAPRESTQDVKVMGYDIKARTQVLVNAWAIGRDPSVWDEPDEFRPERFLNSSIDYNLFHYEWLPFGAGRRGCPGIQFGVLVVESILANLVYKFDLALPNGVRNEDLDMSEVLSLTVVRKFPLLVRATPRV
ncbi:cytochrome P450 Tp4149-like [Rutidosis leptorrhynchoides]|uniref:cytochrome P450 Tp4149-like n=1 Tax=Rutidosis leptorrhynchoides TaxID=125765 RepID=UPI003A9947BF